MIRALPILALGAFLVMLGDCTAPSPATPPVDVPTSRLGSASSAPMPGRDVDDRLGRIAAGLSRLRALIATEQAKARAAGGAD